MVYSIHYLKQNKKKCSSAEDVKDKMLTRDDRDAGVSCRKGSILFDNL